MDIKKLYEKFIYTQITRKGETTMTDKDREQYIEVLFALAGHGNYNKEPEKISHEISHEEEEKPKKRWLWRLK